MRIAPKGKYFIKATNLTSNRVFYPLYDGFNTRKEAQDFCNEANHAQFTVHHEVITKEEK